MKIIFFAFFFTLISGGCSSNKVLYDKPDIIIVLSSDNLETISIRSSGTGNTEKEALQNAETKAFKMLLLKGFTKNTTVRPLIEENSENINIINNFFKNEIYKEYIVSSIPYNPLEKLNNKYYTIRDISINTYSLTKYLENKNVIRKFGF